MNQHQIIYKEYNPVYVEKNMDDYVRSKMSSESFITPLRPMPNNKDEKIITQITYKDGQKWIEEEFNTEANLSAVKWHYKCPKTETDLKAVRENGAIVLKGTFKGKPQEKNYRIGDGLFYQMMDMNMPAFVKSDLDEIVFYSIGTGDNRGAMSLGEFAAKKLGRENVTAEGIEYSCIKVSFVFTMFSWAWTGLYWYDEKTGMLIQNGIQKGKKDTVLCRLKRLVYKDEEKSKEENKA